ANQYAVEPGERLARQIRALDALAALAGDQQVQSSFDDPLRGRLRLVEDLYAQRDLRVHLAEAFLNPWHQVTREVDADAHPERGALFLAENVNGVGAALQRCKDVSGGADP